MAPSHGDRLLPEGHLMRRLAIVVVVLLILLVVADRGGDYVSERLAADKLQSSQNLTSRPDVDVHGVPFLTQFASGDYDHISVDADNVPVRHTSLDISRVHVDLNQVHVSHRFKDFTAVSATANGLVNYADLSRTLHVKVRYAGNGRVKTSKTFTVLGQTVRPSISVAPEIVNGVLRFGKSAINGEGQSVGDIVSTLTGLFDVSVPLQGIPFDITVRSLRVNRQGLELRLVGSDLHYSS